MIVLWGKRSDTGNRLVQNVLSDVKVRWQATQEGWLPSCGDGDIVVGLGTVALEVLKKAGLVPKNRALKSLHGTAVNWNGRYVIPTYAPDAIWLDWSYETFLQADLQLARRLALTGSISPTVGTYTFVNTLDPVFDQIATGVSYVTVDLETLSLDPYVPGVFIVSIQVTVKPGRSYVIRFTGPDDPVQPARRVITPDGRRGWQKRNVTLWDQLDWLLSTERVKLNGANFKYDRMWMFEHWGLHCTNQKFDTTIVGSILNENRSNSLNTHAKIYTPLGGYDDPLIANYDKARMDLVPDEDFIVYAGGDTDACHQVMLKQRQELIADKRVARHFSRVVMPAATAFEKMERTGVLLDVPYYESMKAQLSTALKDIQSQALDLMPAVLQAKHSNAATLTRPNLIRDFMFGPRGLNLRPYWRTLKAEEPSTAMDHLSMFANHSEAGPFVELVKQFKNIEKTLGTYVIGFMKHLRSDGRFHPTAILYKGEYEGDVSGTNTGRLAFKGPAMQTLPKHTYWAKALRMAYIAPPGYVIINVDWQTGELRIAACLSNEPTMIQAFLDGVDLHAKTGGELNGYDLQAMQRMAETDSPLYAVIRQGGKAGNFGLIYGMGAPGFVHYAYSTYGVVVELNEAMSQRDAFFALYNQLPFWHERQRKTAKQDKAVYSPLGRIRHLPLIDSSDRERRAKAERQSVNAPVQATLSDMALLALGIFDERYSKNRPTWPTECQFFMMTHDNLAAYVKADKVHVWVPRILEIMQDLPLPSLGWQPQLTFPVDCEIGPNLAELE